MADAPDQAAGLRRILRPGRLRVLPVLAGMRGTGKTAIVIALAHAAARAGLRVLVLDQSRGDVATALSLTWRRELADLLDGSHDYDEVRLPGPGGCGIVPAPRGLARLLEAGEDGRRLFGGFLALSAPPQLVILNTLDASGCRLVPAPAEILLVARPTRPSITATYARMKDLVRRHGRQRFRLLVNRADEQGARALHDNVSQVARRFLGAEVAYAGAVANGTHSCVGGTHPCVGETPDLAPLAHALERWSLAEFP